MKSNLVRASAVLFTILVGVTIAATPVQASVPDYWAFAFSNTPAPPLPDWPVDPARQAGTFEQVCPGQQATVTSTAVGVYHMRFPCTPVKRGIAHVTTADGFGRFCDIGGWRPAGADALVTVYCFNAMGVASNAMFAVLFMTSSGIAPDRVQAYAHVSAAGALQTGFNSTGGAVTSIRTATGRYRVTFAGVSPGFFAGNLQLTAIDPNGAPRYCAIADWNSHPAATYAVYLNCFDAAGRLTDSHFALSYHHKASIYGVAPTQTVPVAYTFGPLTVPVPDTDANSAGGTNTIVAIGAPGHYDLTFTLVGTTGKTHMQVSTFSAAARYCNFSGPLPWGTFPPDVAMDVSCFGPGGVNTPSRFFLTYATT